MPDTSSAATPAASGAETKRFGDQAHRQEEHVGHAVFEAHRHESGDRQQDAQHLVGYGARGESDAHGQADEHVAQDAAHEQRVPAWRHFNINSGWKKSQYVAFGSQIGETCSGNQQLVVYDAKQGKQLRQTTLPCNRMTYCGTAADFGRSWRGIPQALSHVICTES